MKEDDFLTEEEFAEFYWSLSEEEKIEFSRKLSNHVKENKDLFDVTDEQIAEREAKLEKFSQTVELHKKAKEVLHRIETQMELINQRIEARMNDILETDEQSLAEESKKNLSN